MFFVLFILHSDIVVTEPEGKVKNEKRSQGLSDSLQNVNVLDIAVQPVQQNSTESYSSAALTRHEIDLVSFFSKPIEFTPEGIAYYFKYVYNHPEYIHYLPYNLSHMIQFLEYGIKSGQNETFAASVIKMFLQKMKAVPYVEAESLAEFMPKFTQSMKPYLDKKEVQFLQEMQVMIKEKLTQVFSKYFSSFQKNPDAFMGSLAEQIAQQTNQSATKQHIDVEHLKKDILRFLEICVNKLAWSSKDDIQIWYTCNRLAHECQICVEHKVLCDQNSLDDMCWSLIHRFCYFVELSQGALSNDFYAHVLHDLQTKPLVLVAIPEQEDMITSKKNHLICRMQVCRDMCKSGSQQTVCSVV